MYHGQVNVGQEDLKSFLSAAEDLQIKGLTQENGATNKLMPPAPIKNLQEASKSQDNSLLPSSNLSLHIEEQNNLDTERPQQPLPVVSSALKQEIESETFLIPNTADIQEDQSSVIGMDGVDGLPGNVMEMNMDDISDEYYDQESSDYMYRSKISGKYRFFNYNQTPPGANSK